MALILHMRKLRLRRGWIPCPESHTWPASEQSHGTRTPRTVWGRQSSCYSPELAVPIPGGARWVSWSYNFRINKTVGGGEGGECWVHFNFWKCSSVGKTPSLILINHMHFEHRLVEPSSYSQCNDCKCLCLLQGRVERQKKASIQTSLDTFFKRPEPSKPSPKPF